MTRVVLPTSAVDVVERDDDAAAHGDGARVRTRWILREDVAAAQHQVGGRLGGARGEREQAGGDERGGASESHG